MKATKNLFSIMLTLLLFPISLCAKPQQVEGKPATIKVLLRQQIDGALVEVKGPYKVINPLGGKVLSGGTRGKRYFLAPRKDGLKWGEVYPGIFQIRIVPTDPKTTILVDGIEYRGSLECFHIDDRISLVNEVDIESYIKSVLTLSLPSDIPENVADALAVVARTNAYYTAQANKEAFWHIEAQDANYAGHAATLLSTNVDRGVDATRYLIMTYEGLPFPATWTENSAGKTASYPTIFRKNISAPDGITSPFAQEVRDENEWTLVLAKEALAKIAKTNRVTGIDSFVDASSGKTYAMRIKDGVHYQDLDFLTLQKSLGENSLKSNDYSISLKDNKVIFHGFGKGAGVGLCIYSASCLANKGEAVPHILGTFFPLTHMVLQRTLPDSKIEEI